MNKVFDNAKIFYCKDCKKTFRVTPIEYERDREIFNEKHNPAYLYGEGMKTVLNPVFELNGHRNWIYREDEDYSEYLQAEKEKDKNNQVYRGEYDRRRRKISG